MNKAEKFVNRIFNENLNYGFSKQNSICKVIDELSKKFPKKHPPEYSNALEKLIIKQLEK